MANVIIEAVKEKLFKKDREIRESYEKETGHVMGDLYLDFLLGDKAERAEVGGQLFEYFLYKSLYGIKGHRRFICNPYLPVESGTTEVDVIMISTVGIFVFECKHYSGSIYGKEDKGQWLYYLGNKKYTFFNPIWQNEGHIKALMGILELPREKFLSKIVFPGEIILKVEYKNPHVQVGARSTIVETVKSEIAKKENLFSENEVDAIYEKLQQYCRADAETKKEHLEQVKEKMVTCPKCGGKLVLRKGKNGEFYGCANFPKCRYTKAKNEESGMIISGANNYSPSIFFRQALMGCQLQFPQISVSISGVIFSSISRMRSR